ncbi:MAG: IS630 family transposase [Phycisphaerae bacterium]|nr:IS630 family transposase [Phycisphaerae bacterium]
MIEADKRKAIYLLHQHGMAHRQIARLLAVSRNTVRKIVAQQGVVPVIRRKQQHIDEELLRRLYHQCNGYCQQVHEKLTEEEGIVVTYPTLTRMLRELGISKPLKVSLDPANPMVSIDAARKWLAEITYGTRTTEMLETEVNSTDDLPVLVDYIKNGRLLERKRASVVVAKRRGLTNGTIARILYTGKKFVRLHYSCYCNEGMEVLFAKKRFPPRTNAATTERKTRILTLLHDRPGSYGINRTNWTRKTLTQVYERLYSETLNRYRLSRVLRKIGYKWTKAKRVLNSPDPEYQVKLSRLLRILHGLAPCEMFLFLDEWGPVQVKKRGGKAYRSTTQHTQIPRRQQSKGTVSLVGALSATTNQMTWTFESTKNSGAMIDLLELLYNQYYANNKIYVTWDAVSWHNSVELTEWLDEFNNVSRESEEGPAIELVPLPTSAQFLNVIEGVFIAMTRAIIHNSDYRSPEAMKSAISRHFRERNEYFKHNPKRAGKKIWELDFFNEQVSLESGNYGEW